jgi:ATP dependent DNA ligase-like protein
MSNRSDPARRTVEFSCQPTCQLQRFENGPRGRQSGPKCLSRRPPSGLVKDPSKCREDRVLVALRESWSPRPPVRVAGLTRFPGPQISETRRLWHQLRGYDRITVPSLLRAPSRARGQGSRSRHPGLVLKPNASCESNCSRRRGRASSPKLQPQTLEWCPDIAWRPPSRRIQRFLIIRVVKTKAEVVLCKGNQHFCRRRKKRCCVCLERSKRQGCNSCSYLRGPEELTHPEARIRESDSPSCLRSLECPLGAMIPCGHLHPAHAVREADGPRKLADRHYIAEPKLDGQRAQLHIHQGEAVTCYSRRGLDLLRHPGMAWLREIRWAFESAVFDGEACAGDKSLTSRGRTDCSSTCRLRARNPLE